MNPERLNPCRGGMERVCCNLVAELSQLGHQVVCCYLRNPLHEEYGTVEQVALPDSINPSSRENIAFLHNLLIRKGINILWNHSCYIDQNELCASAAKGTKTKLVYTHHTDPRAPLLHRDRFDQLWQQICRGRGMADFLSFVGKYPLGHIMRRSHARARFRKIYRDVDAFVLLSEHFKRSFLSISGITDAGKLHAIPNPILPLPKEPGLAEKKNQILFVGRLHWQKRLDRILRVWKKLYGAYPGWNLVVLGDGPEREHYEKLAEEMQLSHVSFKGTQAPAPYYRESKILCMSSSFEGFGMVLAEAQQYGCVPITYAVHKALGDIIQDGSNGFSVPPYNSRTFASRLRLLMDDESTLNRMANAGMESVTCFHVDKIVRQWMTLFEQITS